MKANKHILLLTSLVALFVCSKITAEELSAVNITGLHDVTESIVRDVIEIKPGDEFSPEAVNAAIDNLRKWGIFESVDLVKRGSELDFIFKEAKVIVSIDIAGNYPYIENKIRKNLTIHPGDVFSEEKVDEQIEKIKTFYAREGYIGTEVYVDQNEMHEWGGVVLTFHIKRGEALRYRYITVEGNKAYPKGRFVTAINNYKQFSERKLKDSLRKLREFYQKNGYPYAHIKIKDKNMDFQTHRVDVALEVNEGPHVRVLFRGGEGTSRSRLKKTITILREGSIDDYEIEKSAEAIKELYRLEGYPEAEITTSKSELKNGTILVTFNISEGIPSRIKNITFEGNKDVSGSDLAAEMRNKKLKFGYNGPYYPEDIPSDNEEIQKALRRKGYLNAKVGDWDVKRTPQGFALDVKIPIEEGHQTLVQEISFPGAKNLSVVNLLKELKAKPGKPFDEPDLENDRTRLITFYADHGYPYADIKQSWTIDDETRHARITYDIDEGKEVHIGQILIVGDVLTSQKAIRHAMDIREGELFSYKKILNSQLNIRRLGPFAAVNIETIGLSEREPKVHLKVKVEEQRPFTVDLGVSYSTYEQLTGSLTFTNSNAFGWAKSNYLKLTGGEKLSRAEIGWFDPRFLSSSFEMNVNTWIQYLRRPVYAYTQAAGSIGWSRKLRRFGFYFREELDRNYFVQGDSSAANADSLRNNTIVRTAVSASFDSRDSFSDPKRGFYTFGGVDLYNEITGAGANFIKFSWQGENEYTFLKRITLSTALRFNDIETLGSNVSVPTNELLFLGGDYTIRGFAEDSLGPVNAAGNPVGGKLRWIVNEELRIRLWRAFDWAFFFDIGSLTNNFSQINNLVIRRSFGVGLRYLTPVGPLRLDYGFKLDRQGGESRGALHFTFGYVF